MQRRFMSLLLRPSLLSAMVCSVFTALLLGIANWSALLDKLGIRDYLFGADGLIGQLRESSSSYISIFGDDFSYMAFVVCLALFVSISVYILLRAGNRLANDASAVWEALHAQSDISNREMAGHAAVRLGVIIIWLLYLTLFAKLVLPWCIFVSEAGVKSFASLKGWIFMSISAGVLWLALHTHVIFMRLAFLRPRVFGGNDAILTEEHAEHSDPNT